MRLERAFHHVIGKRVSLGRESKVLSKYDKKEAMYQQMHSIDKSSVSTSKCKQIKDRDQCLLPGRALLTWTKSYKYMIPLCCPTARSINYMANHNVARVICIEAVT